MAGLFAKLKEVVVSPDKLRQALSNAWDSLIFWVVAAVATAVAGGVLLYSNVGHKLASPPPSPPRTTSTTSTTLDFSGYFTVLDQLTGQFNEREKFLRSLKGKKVRWHGYVLYVRNSDRSPLESTHRLGFSTLQRLRVGALLALGPTNRPSQPGRLPPMDVGCRPRSAGNTGTSFRQAESGLFC
jgi:hypothetical protein